MERVEQPVVVSIGMNEVNKVVIRVRFSDNTVREVATDMVSFAKLAAMHIPVFNSRK